MCCRENMINRERRCERWMYRCVPEENLVRCTCHFPLRENIEHPDSRQKSDLISLDLYFRSLFLSLPQHLFSPRHCFFVAVFPVFVTLWFPSSHPLSFSSCLNTPQGFLVLSTKPNYILPATANHTCIPSAAFMYLNSVCILLV